MLKPTDEINSERKHPKLFFICAPLRKRECTVTTISEFINRISGARFFCLILPLPLIGIPALWLLAFYAGIYDSHEAYLINIGLRATVAFFFFALGIILVKRDRSNRAVRFPSLLLLAFFSLSFLFAVIAQAAEAAIVRAIAQFLLNALPALVLGVYCAWSQSGGDLLRGLEKYGLIFIPAAIVYVVRPFILPSPECAPCIQRLGGLDYMSFAYGLMPLMVASCLLLFNDERQGGRRLGRWLLIFVYWLAIIFTQTRGAVTGVFLFLLCLSPVAFKKDKKALLVLLASCAVIFVGSLPVLPKVFGTGYARFSEANLNEAFGFSGEVANRLGKSHGYQFLLDNEDNGIFIDRVKNLCTIHNREIAKRIALDNELYESVRDSGCEIKLSRLALIEISLTEIQKRPLFGMGPLAFQTRYFGFHPHNLLLELIVELGVLLGGLIALGLCCLAWVFLMRSRGRPSDQSILLLCVAHIPMFLVSGTIWSDTMFLFAVGYALVFFWTSRIAAKDAPRLTSSAD